MATLMDEFNNVQNTRRPFNNINRLTKPVITSRVFWLCPVQGIVHTPAPHPLPQGKHDIVIMRVHWCNKVSNDDNIWQFKADFSGLRTGSKTCKDNFNDRGKLYLMEMISLLSCYLSEWLKFQNDNSHSCQSFARMLYCVHAAESLSDQKQREVAIF